MTKLKKERDEYDILIQSDKKTEEVEEKEKDETLISESKEIGLL